MASSRSAGEVSTHKQVNLQVQVVWLVDTMSLTMVMLVLTRLYWLCRVLVVCAGLCWWWLSVYSSIPAIVIVLLVAFVFVSPLLRLSLPLCPYHVVVAVILVDSSLLVIINDCQCFHI